MPAKTEQDLQRLLDHFILPDGVPNLHAERVDITVRTITELLNEPEKRLPHTVGLFGSWGTGKTTFLALLAQQLQKHFDDRIHLIYFNAWKYAGFTEIVPALMYHVLVHRTVDKPALRQKLLRLMLSLGAQYASAAGKGIKAMTGVDPVPHLKKIWSAYKDIEDDSEELLTEYYTRVDKAQDLLREMLPPGSRPVVILVDELDRCDPDEAFAVIKQLRVFFAMTGVPLLFVLCANPEPIGMAVRHRFGLTDVADDYETRRILEKFVDSLLDMSHQTSLGPVVSQFWKPDSRWLPETPWILQLDERWCDVDAHADTVMNASGLGSINSASRYYSNLRTLQKSFAAVRNKRASNARLLWTQWHLELVYQVDGAFRKNIATAAHQIRGIANHAYTGLLGVKCERRDGRLILHSDKGKTLFSNLRSYCYEGIDNAIANMEQLRDAESRRILDVLQEFRGDYRRMDFLARMLLLPPMTNESVDAIVPEAPHDLSFLAPLLGKRNEVQRALEPGGESLSVMAQLGWTLANYR
jgi:hypothetical protein